MTETDLHHRARGEQRLIHDFTLERLAEIRDADESPEAFAAAFFGEAVALLRILKDQDATPTARVA